jgi:hypothetical protein
MLPPTELYPGSATTGANAGRYGVRKAIEKLKAAVPIETYAGELTALKPCGKELRGRCPVHGGDNPTSFCVNVEKQVFRCHACSEGGDLISLYRAVEGGELWEVIVGLSIRFSVPLPEKPESWRRWQDEKGVRREMILRIRTRLYQRRLLHALFKEDLDGILDGIADERERIEETERIYADLYYLALRCAKQREEAA